ncbi:actin-binding protein Fragmin [Aspergillus luchuensis]|uniref:Actin-binding protein Fragmin n=1 Tax=Aspergillus kawachii TaxID=1069201 RepID=A0A146F9Y2_ASPKA|nr:actin-binding protein Fragmin [Aspergillus luchuensis]
MEMTVGACSTASRAESTTTTALVPSISIWNRSHELRKTSKMYSRPVDGMLLRTFWAMAYPMALRPEDSPRIWDHITGHKPRSRNSTQLGSRGRREAKAFSTRALVKWNDGNVTLERRGFIRRIANGNSFNGDRMIYLKAKELENAFWGHDVE